MLTFRDEQSSRVKQSKNLEFLTVEDGTDRLCHNVGD
jgi:hypothetical protein